MVENNHTPIMHSIIDEREFPAFQIPFTSLIFFLNFFCLSFFINKSTLDIDVT